MISIVIPAYNEEKNIEPLVKGIVKVLGEIPEKYEILVVDDNSTDDTVKIIKRLSLRFPVRVVSRKGEKGPGLTLRAGFRNAKGDVVITMDADLSHNPEDIPALYRKFRKGFDLVVGSRYMPGGKIDSDGKRKLISASYNMLARILTGVRVKDVTTGYRIQKKTLLNAIDLRSKGFEIHAEIPVKAREKKFRIAEVPICYEKRVRGSSNLKYLKEFRGYAFVISKSFLRRLGL